MFFALVVLRPATAGLEPARRLVLWAGVLKRFFPWVWVAVLVLPITGYWLVFNVFGGFGLAQGYIHVMHLLGLIMIAVFVFLYYKIYPAFKAAVSKEAWPEAGVELNRIRKLVLLNLCLGLVLLCAVAGLQHGSII